MTSLPEADYPASLQTLFAQANPGLKSLPQGLLKATGIMRLNLGTTISPADASYTALQKEVLSHGPKAMFWGADGKVITGS